MARPIPIAHAQTGNTFFAHFREMRANMIAYLEHLAQQGDFLRIPLGPVSAYFVNHPDYVREVLVTQAHKSQKPFGVKQAARALFGENLFTSDGEVWRVLRAAQQPAFHTQRVNAYGALMAAHTNQMLDRWTVGQTVDIPQQMMDLTLGITTKALFNVDLRGQEAGQAIIRFIELFSERAGSPMPIPGWLPTPRNREMKRLIGLADAVLQPIIEERRATGEDKGDVLSMLLLAQKEDRSGILTDHQVRNEINNLFAAGYEVTGNTLAFTLYLLAQHPALEALLVQELATVLGDRPVTLEDLANLPYLELVIRESMRLLPVTTVVARQSVAAIELGDYVIPKNQTVLVAPWTLHRHPAYFPAPLQFDPERFNAARREQIHKHAYIPFVTGPRICLGNAFALLQLKINVATILQRYHLTVAPGYHFEPFFRFNTRPKNGLPMVVHNRKGS